MYHLRFVTMILTNFLLGQRINERLPHQKIFIIIV